MNSAIFLSSEKPYPIGQMAVQSNIIFQKFAMNESAACADAVFSYKIPAIAAWLLCVRKKASYP